MSRLAKLDFEHIFKVELTEDKTRLFFTESSGYWYTHSFNKVELLELINEFNQIAKQMNDPFKI